jgi:anti-sigma B factor antagonist
MEIEVEKIGDVAVVVLPVQELGAENTSSFKRDIASVIEENCKVVFDLSALRFVDSSGLGAMLSCLRQLSAKGGVLKLFGMSKQVRTLFELVRMNKIINIFDTKEEAVQAFQT